MFDRDSILLVDKPAGWTAQSVIDSLRELAGSDLVGNVCACQDDDALAACTTRWFATLEPLASGVLAIGLGAGTTVLANVALVDMEYLVTIRLERVGAIVEPEPVASSDGLLSHAAVDSAMRAFVGDLRQFRGSAVEDAVVGAPTHGVHGLPPPPELAVRQVTVSRFELVGLTRLDQNALIVQALLECTTGTYVRALVRDLAASLGAAGQMMSLRRLRVGPFGVERASTLDQLPAVLSTNLRD
jgi:tRNA pseudouridine55 synthase